MTGCGKDLEMRLLFTQLTCILSHRTHSARWSKLAVFATGFTSALGLVYIAQLVRRYYHPNPERAFQTVLPILRANEEVRKAVGTQLRPGLFRAYSYAGGLEWRRWKLQNEPSRLHQELNKWWA